MDDIQRRAFMKGAAVGALAFTVGGTEVMLTPRQAHAQNVPLKTLTADQAATLDAMGETLVPGAKTAGITHFVDQQISGPPEGALLQARILNFRPPYANFYRAALTAIDNASDKANGGRKFAQLSANEQKDFVNLMRQNKLEGWQGPPGVRLRHSAQRCRRRVYATMEGYEALGVPYMPHIAPTKSWWGRTSWLTKKLTSSSSAPAPRARSMPTS